MRYETRRVRVGEWFPFDEEWEPTEEQLAQGFNRRAWQRFQCLLQFPDLDWKLSGGYKPHDIWHVGMYDGWPYWTPTPAVQHAGVLGGGDTCFWYDLGSDYREIRCPELDRCRSVARALRPLGLHVEKARGCS